MAGGLPAKDAIESIGATFVPIGTGASEKLVLMVPIIFAECPDQSGMHFNGQECVFAEIIDPDSGETLPIETGVAGELVYTSLERECVPLLRFRTRDRVIARG